MAGTRNTSTVTEAVAVFHDVPSFQAAIDDLLLAGFDHGDINVLAHEDTVTSKLGREYQSTDEFEDSTEAPRIGFVPKETIGDAEGAVIGAGVYVPAIAGGAGGLIGAALARFIGNEHAKHLDQHLHRGGLLLWVRTRDGECEQKALDILRQHSADDVHLHPLPERACRESDVPRERPRVIHLLDWTIRF